MGAEKEAVARAVSETLRLGYVIEHRLGQPPVRRELNAAERERFQRMLLELMDTDGKLTN